MMRRLGKLLPALLAVAGIGLLGLPRDARAVPTVEFSAVITSGSASGPVVGTIGPVLNTGNPAIVSTSGTTGDLVVIGGNHIAGDNNIVTGIGQEVLDSTVTSVTNTATTDRWATVLVSGNNFTGPISNVVDNLTARFNQPLTTGSSITAMWFYNTANNLSTVTAGPGGVGVTVNGALGTLTATDSFTATNIGSNNVHSFATNPPITVTPANPFSMNLEFVIRLTPGSVLQDRGQAEIGALAAVPEPGTIALVLAGLPMLGIGAWRRRRAQS